LDDVGQHLDAFVHTVETHHLSAVEASVLAGESYLDGEGQGVRYRAVPASAADLCDTLLPA
ncbi:MAG: hypothetical protein QM207_11105, partial [Thermobispora sp.]|nr:hypothetical protein [Thermobispora sp.]